MTMKKHTALLRLFILLPLVLFNQELNATIVQITSGNGNVNTVSTISSGCIKGSGKSEQEKRKVADFSKVVVSGVFEIQIKRQQQFVVELAGDANILPEIESAVEGDQLRITARSNICPALPLRITIGMPDISQFTSQGVNNVQISGINNKSFTLEATGSSDITVQGSTENFTVSTTGTGDVHAFDLIADAVTAEVQGSGDLQVFVKGPLSATSSGTGDIFYRGTPSEITFTEDGVGELIREK